MTITTTAGAKLYIGGVRAEATDTLIEYEALIWVEVGEIENLGSLGDTSNPVNFTAIRDARVRKLKGTRDAGTQSLVIGRDPLNAGQQALIAAELTKFEYAFKVELDDARSVNHSTSKRYFGALVMGAREEYGTVDNVIKIMTDLAVNTAVVKDDSHWES